MSIAFMLLAISAIILTLTYTRRNHKRAREEKLLLHFSQLGTQHDLSFTSQEMLYNSVIGLDGLKRKLLFLQETNGIYHWQVVDLNTVNHCSVTLKYSGFRFGRRRTVGAYFEKLSLRFHCNDNHLIDVPFYRNPRIKRSLRRHLEQKARHWQTILSKMIVKNETNNSRGKFRQMR